MVRVRSKEQEVLPPRCYALEALRYTEKKPSHSKGKIKRTRSFTTEMLRTGDAALHRGRATDMFKD
jgi:hypothetical protein